MTLAYLSIVLLLVLFIIPYGMGCILIKSKELCLTWMGGFFVSLCSFEVLALIFHAIYGSLHVMVILVCLVAVLLVWVFFEEKSLITL